MELNRRLYDQAREKRVTFSQLLEELDPTPEGVKLDAFERQLKAQKIYTKTVFNKGIFASPMEAFMRTEESAVLFPEFVARTVREAIVEDTMLPYLIGVDTPINTDSYRTFYVDDQPTKQSKRRVTEAAELPRVTIKGREQTVKIYKYGRAIEASYEVLRRMQVDMLALHVRRIAMQTAKDKVAEIIDVIKNGDGNNNAATVIAQKDLTTATAKKLAAEGLLRFLMEFEEFPCDTLIGSKDTFVQMVLTNLPTVTTTDLLKFLSLGATSGVTINSPQLPSGVIRVFWHKDIGKWQIYGLNRANGIEQIQEVGSDITEADKFITRQTSVLTVSENNGYSKIFKEATKILDIEQAST